MMNNSNDDDNDSDNDSNNGSTNTDNSFNSGNDIQYTSLSIYTHDMLG